MSFTVLMFIWRNNHIWNRNLQFCSRLDFKSALSPPYIQKYILQIKTKIIIIHDDTIYVHVNPMVSAKRIIGFISSDFRWRSLSIPSSTCLYIVGLHKKRHVKGTTYLQCDFLLCLIFCWCCSVVFLIRQSVYKRIPKGKNSTMLYKFGNLVV